MRNIFSLFVWTIVVAFNLNAQSGWYSQAPKPSGSYLSSVFYSDDNTIWMVGGSSNVFKSTDGGATWENREVGSNRIFSGIQFVDQFNGILYGVEVEYVTMTQTNKYGIILTTNDAGYSWSLKFRDKFEPNNVFFINQTTGWAVGDSSNVFKTTDSGNNWTEYYCGYNTSLEEVTFLDSQNGWTIGTGIFKTTDGGVNWEEVSSLNEYFTHMYFLNNNLGWVCGDNIYKTTDGGGSWLQLTGFGNWDDIHFSDPENGWCCYHYAPQATYEILKSNDGGLTWFLQYAEPDVFPSTVNFRDNNNGISVGRFGTILTTSNGGSIWDLKTEWMRISLQKVYFPSANTGFTIGRQGSQNYTPFTNFTLKSTDGGYNWSISDSLPSSWFRDIFFVSDLKGWVVGINFADSTGIIKYTDDGGTTWSTQYVLPNNSFNSVYFVDELNGWVGSGLENVLRTTNGGINWEIKSFGFTINTRELFFVNNNIGFCIAEHAFHQIIKTTDAGNTWVDITPQDLFDILYDIDFINEQVGWVVGERGIVLKTTDGGSTWDQSWPEPWPQGPAFHSVDFVSEDMGWIVADEVNYPPFGSFTSIFHTTDGGNNWDLQSVLDGSDGSIYFLNQQTGWFVAGNNAYGQPKIGYVYKTTTGGVTFIENSSEQNIFQKNHILLQNYPNPFNPGTNIKFLLPSSGSVTLKIFNSLGEEITVLLEKELTAGTHEVEWDATGLPSGVYFYQLKAEGFVETRKMVLVK